MNRIVVSGDPRYMRLRPKVKGAASSALRLLKVNGRSIEICLITDPDMRKLNRASRKRDKATNVLSFEIRESFEFPPSKFRPWGEVYLAPDYIERRGEDLLYMLIHGILHLAGYDHLRKSDMMKMLKRERFLLRKLTTYHSQLRVKKNRKRSQPGR